MRFKLLIALGFVLPAISLGQNFQFEFFAFEDGLVNPFIYDIEEGPNHQLFIASGDGLGVYDGKTLTMLNTDNGLAESFVTQLCTFKNKLYVGHQNGALTKYEAGKLSTVSLNKVVEYKVVDLVSYNNELWVLYQNGALLQLGKGKEKWHEVDDLEGPNKLLKWQDNLLVSSANGLMVFEIESGTLKRKEHLLQEKSVSACTLYADKVLVGSDDGFYTINSSFVAHKLHFSKEVDANALEVDYNKNIWISSFDGAYRCLYDSSNNSLNVLQSFKAENGLGTENIQCIYSDFENNIWFGTYGKGIARLQNDYLSFYPSKNEQESVNHIQFKDSLLLYAQGNKIIASDYGYSKEYFNIGGDKNSLPNAEISRFLYLDNGEFWIAYKDDGLFRMFDNAFRKVSLSPSNLSNTIHDILAVGNGIFVATEDGVFELSSEGKVKKHYSTANGLRHNKVHCLFADQYNTVYVGSRSNALSYIKDQRIYEIDIPFEGSILDITAVFIDENGKWLGTSANGVLNIDKGNYTWLNKRGGLYSNNIKGIQKIEDQYLFIHRDGLTRYDYRSSKKVVHDKTNGFAGQAMDLASAWSSNASLWIGSSKGLIRYSPKDENRVTIAPKVFIEKVTVNNKDYPKQKLKALSYKEYNIKFVAKGVSFANDNISYEYRLKGFDEDWQSLQTNTPIFTYNKLPYGSYQFELKACLDGECSSVVKSEKFTIDRPYYLKWWFFVLTGLFLICVVVLILYIRTRNLRKIRNYLAYNLEIKTKEVREQNALLESKNKDITDSINYAQKIQQAMLPASDFMDTLYSDSFLIYQPKDIVSGDFYWYKELTDSLRVIICADCTGHGVPGSLLTMIGGASFQKIISEMNEPDPSSFLVRLEDEFRENLQKNEYVGNSHYSLPDGMDLVVMMHNHKTGEAIFASARRSFIIRREGKWEIVKGDRHSIGGDAEDKQFTNHNFNLGRGDRVYLFSDGYPDQIGGERNRKIMTGNVFKMLQETEEMPISIQGEYLLDYHVQWKAEEMQLDDILFMGFEI
jgi:ligand-binding sensor domain-containing protein/serine phosphatase RsbU (regulator of sigma subunit)